MDPAIYARQFGFCDYVLKANLAGVDQETSLVAPERGGNNLNWVLGHILATRNGIFKLFGIEPFWSDEQSAPYGRGSEPVTADRAMPLEELLAEFDRSQANLMALVSGLTPERLAEPLAEPNPILGDTLGTAMTAYCFHEAYHVGQTGILRRVVGLPGAIP